MEITGQLINNNTTSERPLQLKESEVYRAKMEAPISDREALITIRGQSIKATFTGDLPKEENFSVRVEGRSDNGVRVSVVHPSQTKASSSEPELGSQQRGDHLIREAGIRTASLELKQAVQLLLERNVPLNEKSISGLNQFLSSGIGNINQRTETILTLANKHLEPTAKSLSAIHEALNGKKIPVQIEEMVRRETQSTFGERAPSLRQFDHHMPGQNNIEQLKTDSTQIKESADLTKLLQNLLLTNRSQWPAPIQAIQKVLKTENAEIGRLIIHGLKDALQSPMNDQKEIISNLINQVEQMKLELQPNHTAHIDSQILDNFKSTVEKEADLMKAIGQIKDMIKAEKLPNGVEAIITNGINEAMIALNKGRELKARHELIDAIQKAESTVPLASPNGQSNGANQETLQYITNDILHSAKLSSKDILVTEITGRIAAATDSFKSFQRDISNQLSRVESIIAQFRSQSSQQVKPMLENVIRQLDNALLKNDWLLFTDMKTEKTVLQASSQLAEAKKLLGKGNHFEARQIVREVQQTIDKLVFKPNKQKIIHQLSLESEWRNTSPGIHKISSQYDNASRALLNNEGSGRQVYDGLRILGLNREAEFAQQLISGKTLEEGQQRDIKSLLLQTIRSEEEGSKLQQQAQQALTSLTGNQLLSRQDHQNNMQMLMLQLPLLLKGVSENLQVFINSRNDSGKIDWENCSLYFLMETKKMGEVGISLNVNERALSITLKNDEPSFKRKIEPITAKYLDRLKELGFYVQGLHFSELNMEKGKNNTERKLTDGQLPTMTPKGFDYKI